ncbi:unnamed protein product [Lathyrus sativus]|nr:unnamed protein product [Lathyrus sativus]
MRPIHDRYAVLFTVAIVWLFAQLLTASTAYNHKSASTQNSCRTDRVGLVTSAKWVYLPYPFQWGPPTFNVLEAFPMIVASIVSLFEFFGTSYAVARVGSWFTSINIRSRGVSCQPSVSCGGILRHSN